MCLKSYFALKIQGPASCSSRPRTVKKLLAANTMSLRHVCRSSDEEMWLEHAVRMIVCASMRRR